MLVEACYAGKEIVDCMSSWKRNEIYAEGKVARQSLSTERRMLRVAPCGSEFLFTKQIKDYPLYARHRVERKGGHLGAQ
jgi:hypothetical protein